MTTRRSRMRRTPTGKRLELSERDMEIFRALRRYRYLSSTYIHAFVGGASATRLKERLGDLYHEGYIDRPAVQWEQPNCRYRPAVYACGTKARQALEQAGAGTDEARTFLDVGAHRQFPHALMICDALASIELAAKDDPALRFIAWPEILARAPESTRTSAMPFRMPVPAGGTLIPDGIFGLEYTQASGKAYRFFALEADRGTMPVQRSDRSQTSLLAKLDAYRSVIDRQRHKAHWGISKLLVLTIAPSAERIHHVMHLLGDKSGASSAFLFRSVLPGELLVPAPSLLEGSWKRAGLPPLQIGDVNTQVHQSA